MMSSLLGRTAAALFWMMRYLERMENTARLVDAGFRMSLTRARSSVSEWESVLTTSGNRASYLEKHKTFNGKSSIDFLISDKENPGSVACAIRAARENARTARTTLTREAWEAINETWITLDASFQQKMQIEDLPQLLSQIQKHSALIRGMLDGTMLRNDIFRFAQLGTLFERADNTARILDTKYYVLLPSSASIGSSLDRIQWEMILRSASAQRSFNWLHGGEVSPHAIVDFLTFDVRLPRSIAYCYDKILVTLSALESEYGRRTPAHDMALDIENTLTRLDIDKITSSGLHEFLIDIIARNAQLSAQIETDYRFRE